MIPDGEEYCPQCGELYIARPSDLKKAEEETPAMPVFPKEPQMEEKDDDEVRIDLNQPGSDEAETEAVTAQLPVIDEETEAEPKPEKKEKAAGKPAKKNKKDKKEKKEEKESLLSRIIFEHDDDEDEEDDENTEQTEETADVPTAPAPQPAHYSREEKREEEASARTSHVLQIILIVLIAILVGILGFLYMERPDILNGGLQKIGLSLPGYEKTREPAASAEPSASAAAEATATPAEPTPTPTPATAGKLTVKLDAINIRDTSSTSGNAVGSVKKGETYEVLSTTNDGTYNWYQIGENQWIADQNGEWVDYQAN